MGFGFSGSAASSDAVWSLSGQHGAGSILVWSENSALVLGIIWNGEHYETNVSWINGRNILDHRSERSVERADCDSVTGRLRTLRQAEQTSRNESSCEGLRQRQHPVGHHRQRSRFRP